MGPEDFATLISLLDAEHPGTAVYLDEVQECARVAAAGQGFARRAAACLPHGSNASLLGHERDALAQAVAEIRMTISSVAL